MKDEEEPALPKPGPKPDQITAVIGEVGIHLEIEDTKKLFKKSIKFPYFHHFCIIGGKMAAVKDFACLHCISAR